MLPLQRAVAGIGNFFIDGDGVDVWRIQVLLCGHAILRGVVCEAAQEVGGTRGAGLFQDLVKRFEPFGGFLWVEIFVGFEFGGR